MKSTSRVAILCSAAALAVIGIPLREEIHVELVRSVATLASMRIKLLKGELGQCSGAGTEMTTDGRGTALSSRWERRNIVDLIFAPVEARDYDAYTGRWTARDPILFRGGQAKPRHVLGTLLNHFR